MKYQNLYYFSESQFPHGSVKKVLGHKREPQILRPEHSITNRKKTCLTFISEADILPLNELKGENISYLQDVQKYKDLWMIISKQHLPLISIEFWPLDNFPQYYTTLLAILTNLMEKELNKIRSFLSNIEFN